MAAQRTRPFIGINADLVIPAKTTPITRLGIGYADAVTQSGGLPVVLPPYAKDLDLDSLLDRLDGLVFTGGLDLDPRGPANRRIRPSCRCRNGAKSAIAGSFRPPLTGACRSWRSASACNC